jgi:hypothetical protein
VPEVGEGRVFYVSDLVAAQVQSLHVSEEVKFSKNFLCKIHFLRLFYVQKFIFKEFFVQKFIF